MKRIFFFSVAVLLVASWSCSKTTTSTIFTAGSSSSIWPIKAGNNWIYQDSVFNSDGTVAESYADSAYINTQTAIVSGVGFYGITDSLGWFGTGGLVGVDPTNTIIYSLDSLNATNGPYLFFSLAPSDAYLLGTYQDFSNASCISLDASYGFASVFVVAGYNCYKNIEYIKDCNGNITYTTVTYISPGVGPVRLEEYSQVPGSTTNALYLDYSQTLKAAHLK
jgi:hypothetical protein